MPGAEHIALEVGRRLGALPRELDAWTKSVSKNADGQGIHRSQVLAIDELLKRHVERLRTVADGLPAPGAAGYADAYFGLLDELVELQDLWLLLRGSFAQRREPLVRPVLDAADLIAADGFRACLAIAGVDPDTRAPPLVCLEAARSPAALPRGEEARHLRQDLRGFRDVGLPIPLVLLPADHADSLWLHCAILHEVGHDASAELGIAGELQKVLLAQLASTLGPRRDTWWGWMPEVVADAVGVALGGAGFAQFLASALLVVAPASRFEDLAPREPHPSPHVRVPLLCELLRAHPQGEWKPDADALLARWEEVAAPEWTGDFVDDVGAVAALVMAQPLQALGNKRLADVAAAGPAPALVRTLARYLAGAGPRPDARTWHPRYHAVAAAAQLALSELATADAAALDRVHQLALKYVSDHIPRPTFLAGKSDLELREVFAKKARGLGRLRLRSTP